MAIYDGGFDPLTGERVEKVLSNNREDIWKELYSAKGLSDIYSKPKVSRTQVLDNGHGNDRGSLEGL